MKLTIVLTGFVALIAFLWIFSYTVDITASSFNLDSSLNPLLEKWSSNALTLSIAVLAILLIGAIKKSTIFTIISIGIVLVGAWVFWI